MSLRDRYQNLGVVPAYGQLTAEHLFGDTGLTHEYFAIDWWKLFFGPLAGVARKFKNTNMTKIENPCLLVGMFTSKGTKVFDAVLDVAHTAIGVVATGNAVAGWDTLLYNNFGKLVNALAFYSTMLAGTSVLSAGAIGNITAAGKGSGLTGNIKGAIGKDDMTKLMNGIGATNLYSVFVNKHKEVSFLRDKPPFEAIKAYDKFYNTVISTLCRPCEQRELTITEKNVFAVWKPEIIEKEITEVKTKLVKDLFDIRLSEDIPKKDPNYPRYVEWDKFYKEVFKRVNDTVNYINKNVYKR